MDKLQEVAIAADEYTLSHRTYGNPYGKWKGQTSQSNPNKDSGNKGNTSRDSSPKKGKGQGSPDRGSPSRGTASGDKYKNVECYFCRKRGHVRSQCFRYKRFLEQEKKPIGLLAGYFMKQDSSVPKGYRNHMSIGQVSSDTSSIEREVHILRDTGALQSVILRSALPADFVEVNSECVIRWFSQYNIFTSHRDSAFEVQME